MDHTGGGSDIRVLLLNPLERRIRINLVEVEGANLLAIFVSHKERLARLIRDDKDWHGL
jgi:hypothetical protein